MDFIMQSLEWHVAGILISIVMFLLYYFGEQFGGGPSNLYGSYFRRYVGAFFYGVYKDKLPH